MLDIHKSSRKKPSIQNINVNEISEESNSMCPVSTLVICVLRTLQVNNFQCSIQ